MSRRRRLLGVIFSAALLVSVLSFAVVFTAREPDSYSAGREYLLDGNPDEALTAFGAAISDNPRNAKALYYQAVAYENAGDADNACHALRKSIALHNKLRSDRLSDGANVAHEKSKAVTLGPELSAAHNMLGRFLLAQAKYTEAIDHFSRALQINSNLANALYGRGLAFAALDVPELALEDLSKAASMTPNDGLIANHLASVQLREGRVDDAVVTAQRAILLEPFDMDAHKILGEAYAATGQFEQAIAHLRRALTLAEETESAPAASVTQMRSDLANVHLHRGACRLDTAEWSPAAEDFQIAIAMWQPIDGLEDNVATARCYLAVAQIGNGEADDRSAELGEALSHLSDDSAARIAGRLSDGAAIASVKGDEASVKAFAAIAARLKSHLAQGSSIDKAADIKPAQTYSQDGWSLFYRSELDPALAEFDKALRLDSDCRDAQSGRAATLLAKAQASKGQEAISFADDAMAAFTAALAVSDDDASDHYGLGAARLLKANLVSDNQSRGLAADAIKSFSRSLEIDRRNADAYLQRARAFVAIGDKYTAAEDFTQTLVMQPRRPSVLLERANTYASIGQPAKAANDCTEVIRMTPDNAEAYLLRGSVRLRDTMSPPECSSVIADLQRGKELAPEHSAEADLLIASALRYRGGRTASESWRTKAEYDNAIADLEQAAQVALSTMPSTPNTDNGPATTGPYTTMSVKVDKLAVEALLDETNTAMAEALYYRGKLFMNEGEYDKAVHDFTDGQAKAILDNSLRTRLAEGLSAAKQKLTGETPSL